MESKWSRVPEQAYLRAKEPPLNERVLTWDSNDNCQVGMFIDHVTMGRIWQFGGTFTTNVTHWMPLPTGPSDAGESK